LESILKRNLLIHLDSVKAYNFYKKSWNLRKNKMIKIL
jgi:hypothetical protein